MIRFDPRQKSDWKRRGLVIGALSLTLFSVEAPAEELLTVPAAQEKVASTERTFGTHHLNTAVALQLLGESQRKEKQWQAARTTLERALTIRLSVHGPDHPLVSRIRTTLAGLYLRLGDRKEAIQQLLQVLEASRRQLGPEHVKTAQAQVDLARVYGEDPDHQTDVIRLLEGAIPLLENNLWKDHPQIAEALALLGRAHFHMGDSAKAEQAWLRALQIQRDNLGSDHPAVATTLLQLGRLQIANGNNEEGERWLREALAIFRRTTASDDPRRMAGLESLAEFLVLNQRPREALPLMEKMVAAGESRFGKQNPGLIKWINHIGLIHMEEKAYQQAQEAFNRSLALAEQQLGNQHIQVAFILGNLSELQRLSGHKPEAQRLFDRSVTIARQFFAGDDMGLANWFANIAATLHKSGNLDGATQLFNQSLHLIESTLGPDHPQVQQVRRSLLALKIPLPPPSTPAMATNPAITASSQGDQPAHPTTAPSEPRQNGQEVVETAPALTPRPLLTQPSQSPPSSSTILRIRLPKPDTPTGSAPSEGKIVAESATAPENPMERPATPDLTKVPEKNAASKETILTHALTYLPDEDRVALFLKKQTQEKQPKQEDNRFKETSSLSTLPRGIPVISSGSPPQTGHAVSPRQKKENPAYSIPSVPPFSLYESPPTHQPPRHQTPSESRATATPPTYYTIQVGCYLPASLIPKQMMKTLESMRLPVYHRAKIKNHEIYACLYVGPLSDAKAEVTRLAEEIVYRLKLPHVSILKE